MHPTRSLFLALVAFAAIADAQSPYATAPRYSVPTKVGNRLFYSESSGLLNQSVLFVKDGNRPPRILLDPNSLSTDGTVALALRAESPNGRFLGYGVSVRGSAWRELRVRDVENGRDTRDTLKWVKASDISWTRDNRGFFYSGYDPETSGKALTNVNGNQRVYYHTLGTPQSADQIVYERKDQPSWQFDTRVTEDGVFAVITVYQNRSSRTRLYYVYLDNPKRPRVNAPVVRLIDNFDSENEFIHNMGDNFLVRTDLGAPRGRLVQIDIINSQPARWVTVIPEARDALQKVNVAGERLVTSYLQDAQSSLRVYGMPQLNDPRRTRGTSGPGGRMPAQTRDRAPAPNDDRRTQSAPGYPYLGEIKLPGIGTVDAISSRAGDNGMFYSFMSSLSPRAVYHYDVKRGTSEVFKAPLRG